MWRNISRPASVIGIVAVLVLVGCGEGEGDQATSAGAPETTSSTGTPTTLTTTTASTAAAAATAARCSNVTFSSNIEDVASDIRSTGLSCTDAEALVRKIGPQLTVNGPSRVETDGFACSRTSLRSGDHGPPIGSFECANGATKVIFLRALVA